MNLTRTRIHPVLMFFVSKQHCLDSVHPRLLTVRTVAPEQAALIIHGSRRLKNCKHSAAQRTVSTGTHIRGRTVLVFWLGLLLF